MEIIDAHQHIGDLSASMGDSQVFEQKLSDDADHERRVETMRSLGVSWAVIQPSHGYLKPDGIKDTMRVNDAVAAYRDRDPVHFPIALGTVEPMYGERGFPEIDRAKHELKLDGLSWHHRFQGCFIDNKWIRPILRRMAELDMVPLIHTLPTEELEASWRLQKLAYEFPELTFLALDAFMAYEGRLQALHIAEHTPNILWDIHGVHSISAIEPWIQEHGSEKLVFSGEMSYSAVIKDRRPVLLDEMLESSLPDDDKANIMGRNIRRLFPNAPPPRNGPGDGA